MMIVDGWSGREAKLLRKALRLSVRDFAAHLGVGTRTINKWEARQADITPHPHMQEVLDTALARASDEAKARFAATTRAERPEHQTAQLSGPPVQGVMVPIGVNGCLVFVPLDAAPVAGRGLSALWDELATTGTTGDLVVDDVCGRLEACHADDGSRGPGPALRVTVGQQGDAEQKVASWVQRREFGQHVATLALSAMGAAGLDTDRLLALLPQAEPTGTRHIGTADVEIIEQSTAAFRRQDWAHGSGLIQDAAVEQLRAVLPLLNAQVAPELRPRLLVAAADLALQAAWMSFDQCQHDAARRLWVIGLDTARDADHHPWATDLTVHLLINMANQAEHLGHPDEVLHLLRTGHTTASRRRHPVSPAETTALNAALAWAHAATGDPAACDRALGQAVDQFSSIDQTVTAPWTANINGAFLAARQGHAHYALALANQDSQAAGRAVPLLRQAVDHYGPGYARSPALYLPELAGAHALAGDLDTAVTVGHQAVDVVTAVSSARAHGRLRTLHTVLEPLHTSPSVADLRDRLTATAA